MMGALLHVAPLFRRSARSQQYDVSSSAWAQVRWMVISGLRAVAT